MTSNISELESNLVIAKAFVAKHGEALNNIGMLSCGTYSVSLEIPARHCAEAGEIFGKDGWAKELQGYSTNGTINWTRTIDGVDITISDAEKLDIKGTPVPPNAFPLMLANAPESGNFDIHF